MCVRHCGFLILFSPLYIQILPVSVLAVLPDFHTIDGLSELISLFLPPPSHTLTTFLQVVKSFSALPLALISLSLVQAALRCFILQSLNRIFPLPLHFIYSGGFKKSHCVSGLWRQEAILLLQCLP